MSSQATLVYKANLTGSALTAASLAALLASVPAPLDIFELYGVRSVSDATVAGPPAIRTLVVSFLPVVTATAVASIVPGDPTGSPVASIAVTLAGSGYVRPPVVSFIPVVNTTSPIVPALAEAYLKVATAAVGAGGAAYSAQTRIDVIGRQRGGSTPAVLTPIIAGGIVTGVTITSAGSGYTNVPEILVVDPTGAGSGALVSVSMGVGEIVVERAGVGYVGAPAVVLTPYFKALFPDVTGGQAAPFQNLITAALNIATSSPIDAEPVALS
jgi:hypothetical protein